VARQNELSYNEKSILLKAEVMIDGGKCIEKNDGVEPKDEQEDISQLGNHLIMILFNITLSKFTILGSNLN